MITTLGAGAQTRISNRNVLGCIDRNKISHKHVLYTMQKIFDCYKKLKMVNYVVPDSDATVDFSAAVFAFLASRARISAEN